MIAKTDRMAIAQRVAADAGGITTVAAALRAGEVAGVPTETVYGLAGNACCNAVVAKIFQAKGRPAFDPLIVHIADPADLPTVAVVPDPIAGMVRKLSAAFWPGPFTLVLPKVAGVSALATSGLETVAIRCTAHPVFQRIIRACGMPLAAPSANRFGKISPTTAEHVMSELGDRIPFVMDGGSTLHGVESTILLPLNDREAVLLRAGPVTKEMLEAVGVKLVEAPQASASPLAPGLLAQHYAPGTPLVLQTFDKALPGPVETCAVLAWTQVPPTWAAHAVAVEVLSANGDPVEGAAALFGAMRRLDASGARYIVAEPVPETGLGLAIMDRLRRAATQGEGNA